MLLDEFLTCENNWWNSQGPDSDIVISSRIRLARNIEGYPFPQRAALPQKEEILSRVKDAVSKIEGIGDIWFIKMDTLSDLDKQFLWERHLLSREHLSSPEGKALIVSARQVLSIMINEEDHLRVQALASGFNLQKIWQSIDWLDDDLSRQLSFSFSPDIGYLTACPTNVGTALRASCMLHLPALVLTKQINKILDLVAKLSFTTRGLFGEGTKALGNFFQVSNQASLGNSCEEIINNLCTVVQQVRQQELGARDNLLKKYRYTFEDNIWRSLGILRNCRLISTPEAFSHLSMLCVGLELGIIKHIDRNLINDLFITIQPAHLQRMEGRILKEQERDYIRAAILRKRLREK